MSLIVHKYQVVVKSGEWSSKFVQLPNILSVVPALGLKTSLKARWPEAPGFILFAVLTTHLHYPPIYCSSVHKHHLQISHRSLHHLWMKHVIQWRRTWVVVLVWEHWYRSVVYTICDMEECTLTYMIAYLCLYSVCMRKSWCGRVCNVHACMRVYAHINTCLFQKYVCSEFVFEWSS